MTVAELSKINLDKIMKLAIFLKITPIVEGCEKIFGETIDSSNSISTWKSAKSENLDNLRNIAFEYSRQNYEEVFFLTLN